MKATTLLSGLLFSGALLAGQPQLSHPQQAAADLQQADDYQARQHAVKPPRLFSPAEFDRIQAQQHNPRHHSPLPVQLTPAWQQQKLHAAPVSPHLATLADAVANASVCTSPAQLLSLYDTALVEAVVNADLSSCLYGLYNTAFVGSAHFADAKLYSIVQAIAELLTGFDGSDASGAVALEKLVTYLRAMHWAESSAGSGRQFSTAYRTALVQAFDQYFAGSHFVTFSGNSSRNFMLRYEMLILVSSSGTDRLRYLPRFSEAVKGYASSVSRANNWGISYEENGMTQLLTHYYQAVNAGGSAVEQTLLQHPQIISNLADVVLDEGLWLVGHTREYQWSDAITELGRMLKFGGSIADSVRPVLQQILSSYSFGGTGSNGWVNAQSMVTFYDSANCHLYGNACSFDLQQAVLSGQHTCGSSLKVRYQPPISSGNLQQICTDLAQQEQHFHTLFGTSPDTAVANDNNTDLEVVIFRSSAEYQHYAGTFFNISTNNGGMYLEGTPSDPANQARFIAYQATWLQPDFVVWNLEHEYVHYLDGRFNQWGAFSDQPANTVWWSEGLAEYLSQPEHNPNALAVAASKSYQLSELFQTTYNNGDTARVYYWGYLATRFMFEQQRHEIDNSLLPSMRAAKYAVSDSPCLFAWGWRTKPEAIANNWLWLYDDSEWSSGYWVWTCGQQQAEQTPLPEYTPYADILAGWGSSFDAAFHSWLDCLVAGNGVCSSNQYHPADLDLNGVIDQRDIDLFNQLLRQGAELGAEYDFNGDSSVDQRDIRAMMQLCTLPRCALSQ